MREVWLIFIHYCFDEMAKAEIGGVPDFSESRVSRIHKEIQQELRARFRGTLCVELVA